MEYETIRVVDEESGDMEYRLVDQKRLPIDIDRDRPVYQQRVIGTRVSVRRSRHIRVPIQSPSQDALSRRSSSLGRGPKTLGDTNEFISAFWVNGKPKCRKGYRYDFRRKMCRLIK
jgi:hypothetical protein